ncbi:alpha-N-acetylglucosaminidase [Nakamurella sp. DB0629]|uniref:Alpha-N-acetylglucosaminidase n=1 Tax=Nakamurella aerolata TaxID=1656892 RepID=A0A849A8L7_9ACTN|nr:alpha-N-acetylglucosaminidase [Nakamurella aerolata]
MAAALGLSLVVGTVLAPAGTAQAAPAAAKGAPSATAAAGWSTAPAMAATKRLLGDVAAARFVFVAEQPAQPGVDSYRVAAQRGRILIGGNSPAVLVRGLNAYLTEVAKVEISWNGDSLGANPRLPLPTKEITGKANAKNRYIFNDTDDGYTGAYRGWDEWQRTIDVLALHGVNEVFVPVGTEAVYLDTFTKFGYSKAEMLSWIPQAAHQPWWLLQNISSFPSPISETVLNQRAALGKQIVGRLDELGMKAVLPGYFGTVPDNFAARNPGAKTVPQGLWCAVQRPDWLDPTNAVLAAVAKEFYAASKARLGTAGLYKMDLLHEGGRAGDVNVAAASKAVQASLETARPGALWAILGWQNNPLATTLNAVDKSKMLIVDGISDRYNNLNRETQWQGTPYAFGSIWNFGGHTTMGANIGVWNQRYWAWKSKAGSALDGIAVMPEGSDNNPVAFEFLTDLAWAEGPADLTDWYTQYAQRRYGGTDANAAAAWNILASTAYNTPSGTWSEAQDSLFTAQPSLTVTHAATWSPGQMRYDAAAFAAALPKLLAVDPKLRNSSAYRYDLMDVSRQVLANTSREMLPQIKKAYDAKDLTEFRLLTERWIGAMRLLDTVTGSNAQTMLGPWLAQTDQWGASEAERRELRTDSKLLLTVWLNRTGSVDGQLKDYANREWSGLISGYYLPRWQAYFDSLDAALVSGSSPKPIDWFAMGDAWAKGQQHRHTAHHPVRRHQQARCSGGGVRLRRRPARRGRPAGRPQLPQRLRPDHGDRVGAQSQPAHRSHPAHPRTAAARRRHRRAAHPGTRRRVRRRHRDGQLPVDYRPAGEPAGQGHRHGAGHRGAGGQQPVGAQQRLDRVVGRRSGRRHPLPVRPAVPVVHRRSRAVGARHEQRRGRGRRRRAAGARRRHLREGLGYQLGREGRVLPGRAVQPVHRGGRHRRQHEQAGCRR